MGCATSCRLFTEFRSALHWAAIHKLGLTHLVFVLDDFLFLNSSLQSCHKNLHDFLAMCSQMGVPISQEKTFPPAQTLSFLGIELDVVRREARLPPDKLDKCRNLVSSALGLSKITLRDLQSLIGSLNFACRVVIPGRAFLRRLINLTIGKKCPFYHIRLNKQAKADLRAWDTFLQSFNGKCFFQDDVWLVSESLHLFTDASKVGFGAVFSNQWLFGAFPRGWQDYDIWILELYAIVVAFVTWSNHFHNRKVLFHCDNANIVHVINSLSTANKTVMSLIRFLVVSAMQVNCCVRATHVPGSHNHLADLLSRLQIAKFKEAHPAADPHPAPVPHHLHPDHCKLD